MAEPDGKKLVELRVIDLKMELERRGLDKTGNKAALLERLSKVIFKPIYSKPFINPDVKLLSIFCLVASVRLNTDAIFTLLIFSIRIFFLSLQLWEDSESPKQPVSSSYLVYFPLPIFIRNEAHVYFRCSSLVNNQITAIIILPLLSGHYFQHITWLTVRLVFNIAFLFNNNNSFFLLKRKIRTKTLKFQQAIADEGGKPEEYLIVPSGGPNKITPRKNSCKIYILTSVGKVAMFF